MTEVDPSPRSSRLAQDRKSRSKKRFLRDVVILFLAAVIVSVGIKTYLVRSFYIPSGSMKNTLQIDDRIIVDQLVPRLIPVARGDVVVFTDPGGWLGPQPAARSNPLLEAIDWAMTAIGLSTSDSNNHLIKRVIGLPGDTVTCCDAAGKVEINGVPIEEPYIALFPGHTRSSDIDFSVAIPADSLWVMGDNRDNSRDSRYHQDDPTRGFVPIADVVGRAFVITWPLHRLGWLDDYPNTFRGVAVEGR